MEIHMVFVDRLRPADSLLFITNRYNRQFVLWKEKRKYIVYPIDPQEAPVSFIIAHQLPFYRLDIGMPAVMILKDVAVHKNEITGKIVYFEDTIIRREKVLSTLEELYEGSIAKFTAKEKIGENEKGYYLLSDRFSYYVETPMEMNGLDLTTYQLPDYKNINILGQIGNYNINFWLDSRTITIIKYIFPSLTFSLVLPRKNNLSKIDPYLDDVKDNTTLTDITYFVKCVNKIYEYFNI